LLLVPPLSGSGLRTASYIEATTRGLDADIYFDTTHKTVDEAATAILQLMNATTPSDLPPAASESVRAGERIGSRFHYEPIGVRRLLQLGVGHGNEPARARLVMDPQTAGLAISTSAAIVSNRFIVSPFDDHA
jgi:hypothetical protein